MARYGVLLCFSLDFIITLTDLVLFRSLAGARDSYIESVFRFCALSKLLGDSVRSWQRYPLQFNLELGSGSLIPKPII